MIKKNTYYAIFTSLLVFSLFILGCTPNVTFHPNKLPIAKVGQPYYVEITISGGGAPIIPRSFYSEIVPENGLKIDVVNQSDQSAYNNLKVFGTPMQSGNTKIIISGSTYGTNFVGAEFEKTYIIEVKEADK